MGGSTLESYTYLSGNGPLSEVHYGNGAVLKHTYDRQERIVAQSWNGVQSSRSEYDDLGMLTAHHDLAEGIDTDFCYDMTGRMVWQKTERSDGGLAKEVQIGYDEKNRVENLVHKLGSRSMKVKYGYG